MGDHFISTPDSFSVLGGPISRLLPHTLTRTVNITVEEIFRDLMTDTHQAEEILKNQVNSLNFDRKELDLEENTAEDRESVAKAPSDRWLKALGAGSVNATIRTELVEALVVLEAGYWLDRQASGKIYPPFHHCILSHYSLSQSTSTLLVGAERMRPHSTTAPNPTQIHLLSVFARYHEFTKTCGWKCLAILSLSRSFRTAASSFSDTQWQKIVTIISQNKGSFGLICQTIRPHYGVLLVTMLRVLGATESIIDNPSGAWVVVNNWMYNTASTIYDHLEMQHSNSPMARRYWNHPHRWYVALDKQSIKSVEPVYIPIVESRLRIPDFTDENDPRYVSKDRGALKGTGAGRKMVCEFCETKGFVACSCTFHSIFPGPLIEIMETDRKGLGVRSLQTIKPGAILGEYAGLIRADATRGDAYSLNGHLDASDKSFYLTTSKHMGNFTRFVNHSCSPNCVFYAMSFRGGKMSVLSAVEKIELFDEITTDYGDDYFLKRNLGCKCGTAECRFSREEGQNGARINR